VCWRLFRACGCTERELLGPGLQAETGAQVRAAGWHPHGSLWEPGLGSGKVGNQIFKQCCGLVWKSCIGSDEGTVTEGAPQKLEIGCSTGWWWQCRGRAVA